MHFTRAARAASTSVSGALAEFAKSALFVGSAGYVKFVTLNAFAGHATLEAAVDASEI